VLRRQKFLTGTASRPGELPDVSWYGVEGQSIDWESTFNSLTCLLGTCWLTDPSAQPVLIMMHSGGEEQPFAIPEPARKLRWRLLIDTAAEAPNDIYPKRNGPLAVSGKPIVLAHHSLRCYVAE
jgi:glycogen operon protein